MDDVFDISKIQRNVAELTQALQHNWVVITIHFISRLINSMARRLQAYVRAQGGHTGY